MSATKTKPAPSTVVTTIPLATDVATMSEALVGILITETPATIKRFDAYDSLDVTAPLSDAKSRKTQLKAVHEASIEIRDAINTIDKERLKLDEDDRQRIKQRMAAKNALWAILVPKRERLEAIKTRVEAEQEAERVAAKTLKIATRKAALTDIVGEFTDMLLIFSDEVLFGMGEKEFTDLTDNLPVQVSVRRAAADAARLAKEAADKAERDRLESEQKAEALRLKQQAIEDQQRKAEREKLDAERAEFDRQQREAAERQAEADAARELADAERLASERAKLAAERAELESQRMAIEDERKRQEAAALAIRQAEADRVAAENRAFAESAELERQRLKAENDALVAKAEAAILEAMRPDIEKLREWVATIEEVAVDTRPTVITCEDMLMEMVKDLAGAIDSMRGRLT